MAVSKTALCNLALTHIGIGVEIANVDTEKSNEARAFLRVYDTALEKALREFPNPFSTKIATLSLITEREVDDEHPTTEWRFQYGLPVDSLMFRKIQSGMRTDDHESRVPYRQYFGSSTTVIFADRVDAVCEYTIRVTDTNRYPPDFDLAFSLLLAALVAPRLTAGDPFKLGEKSEKKYEREVLMSRSNAFNEEQADQEPDPPSIQARS